MSKKSKITQLQKELLEKEPSIELVNEYVLEKFPKLKKDYQNHPLKTTKNKKQPTEKEDEESLRELLCFLVDTYLNSSNDYMDDEKKSIMKWVNKQSFQDIFDIFTQHIRKKKAIKNILSANITAKELKGLEDIVTDCWQLAYLESLTLPESLRILVQILMNKIFELDEKVDEQSSEEIFLQITKTEGKKILEILEEHVSEPYQFLRRFCYILPETKEDIITASKITLSFLQYWKSTLAQEQE